MEAAEIGATKFTHAGALVLDPRLKGPVKHALPSKETEEELPTLQFDPKLNEIVDIGSDVEVLKEEKYDSAEDEKVRGNHILSLRFRFHLVSPTT
ncbi:hypothetical protein COOONC_24186 [Cooperia oncophora]